MPYTKEQKKAWASEHRKKLKKAVFPSWQIGPPPKYSSVIGRITIHPKANKIQGKRPLARRKRF